MWNGEFGSSISWISTHRRAGRSQALQLCVIFAGWLSSLSARVKVMSSRAPSAGEGLLGFELEVAVHKVFQGHTKTVRLGDGIGDGTCGASGVLLLATVLWVIGVDIALLMGANIPLIIRLCQKASESNHILDSLGPSGTPFVACKPERSGVGDTDTDGQRQRVVCCKNGAGLRGVGGHGHDCGELCAGLGAPRHKRNSSSCR